MRVIYWVQKLIKIFCKHGGRECQKPCYLLWTVTNGSHALVIILIVFQMKENFFSISVYQTFLFLVTLLALNHLFPCCISLENSVVGKRRSYLLSTDFTYVSQYGFRFFMKLYFLNAVSVL